MTDGIISISETFLETIPRNLASQVTTTVNTLRTTPESPGLHVEPIHNAKDDRVRSVRVNRQYRILAFRLNSAGQDLWLVEGVYDHDEAYRRARTLYLRMNPISGTTEIRTDEEAISQGGGFGESEVQARAAAMAAEQIAEHQQREAERQAREAEHKEREAAQREREIAQRERETGREASTASQRNADPGAQEPSGPILTVSAQQLIDELGIDSALAAKAAQADETELLDLADKAPSWQGSALLDLATGESIETVRTLYFTGVSGGSDVGTPSHTDELVSSLTSERSKASFHLIEDDESLSAVLASGSFDKWRIFLHPEQETYVNVRSRGPYRLTGGAGTGKTVVLVHRAVRLAKQAGADGREVRIVLTTFTRNLADSLEEQVRILDPEVRRTSVLGQPGIHVTGVDRIAHGVVHGAEHLDEPMSSVLGWSARSPKFSRPSREWANAVRAAGATGSVKDTDQPHVTPAFLIDEYREVILPSRIVDEADYLRVSRPGRGTRLGRRQRREVWAVVKAYRQDGKQTATLDWDETSAVASAVLDADAVTAGARLADHVLVDEGQDLRPTQWQMLRALVSEGNDDMFIAEDSHQRIYSNPVKLGRYGIAIRGRSRRLKLNYRTTAQNLAFAVSVLQGGDFDIAAMEDELVDSTVETDVRPEAENDVGHGKFRSARSGPAVQYLPAKSLADEVEQVAALLRTWAAEVEERGGDISTIGLLTRYATTRDTLVKALDDRGVPVSSVDRNIAYRKGAPLAMTFHRAKGMEFTHVVLFGVDADKGRGAAPKGYDEQTREAAELQERSLLYVGATRARDRLALAWSGERSPYVSR